MFVGKKQILTINDTFYPVEGYYKGKPLKKGIGYIYDGVVYIYRGKKKDDSYLPGIYKLPDGEYEFVEPKENDIDKYDVSNVTDLNINNIFSEVNINKDQFISAEDIEVINNNSSVFTPTIRPEDDFLKYLIKKAILDKKINLKNYKNRFQSQYALNNMKSTLEKDTKMTVGYFKIWCEVLGLKWDIVLSDSGEDTFNPLPEDIYISSNEF